jgi:hypothetical protein
MKKILAAMFAVSTLIACSGATTDEGTPDDPNVLQFRDTRTSTSGGNLIDHGGKTLPTSNTYAIWWGSPTAWASDVQSGLDSMFEGLNGTTFLGISNQYMRGSTSTSAFHTNWTDTSAPPNHSPSTSTIVGEACKVLTANGQTPDATGIYFVYTSNFPHANFCAWHSHGTCNGVDIQVAYMPNTTGVSGCNPLGVANLSCNGLSEGAQSLANVTSHEFMETITDADISAWYDSSGSEIGDKCAWKFSGCVSLSTGSWQLQEEWSNAVSGCVQQ